MKVTVAVTAALLVGIFAVTMAPAVFAATGTFSCISPAGCSSGDVALNGPGNSVVLTYNLNTNAGSGATMIFYVCPQTANTCSSPSGTDNGWSWSISPTSAVTDASGDVNGIQLTITAPSTVTSTNTQESLVIYACSGTGSSASSSGPSPTISRLEFGNSGANSLNARIRSSTPFLFTSLPTNSIL